MDNTAFLSVRVPVETRSRIKAVAAARGEKLQDLVGRLIEDFLHEAERQPPQLAATLRQLRDQEPALRREGVADLWVFGSVARGDAGPDSDVDIAVAFSPEASPSLFDIARLKRQLEQSIGRPVDIGERSAMKPGVAAAAERDMVRVF
jgi:predicted nucleotidyltransferase